MLTTKHHFTIVAGTPFIAALVATRQRALLASLTTFGLAFAAASPAFADPPTSQGKTDMMFTVDRPTNTEATPEKSPQRWDGVPSYLRAAVTNAQPDCPSRLNARRWVSHRLAAESVRRMPEIGIKLPLAELYEGV